MFKYPVAYQTWGDEEINAATDCLVSGETTMGRRVQQFEREFAQYLGVNEAVMVNSGSSANYVMMLAAIHLGLLHKGDEILLPAVTWPTQAWAAIMAGLNVRFVDVDSDTLQMAPEAAREAVTPKTKAIFLAHLMGLSCAMTAFQEMGLPIFEDCCEALGTTYQGRKLGTFGTASAFSFFYSHHITTMEGGMIATNSPAVAESCRMIRAHGWDRYDRSTFIGPGLNFRPTELNGAFGLVQLPKLDSMNAARNQNAAELNLNITNYFQWAKVLPYFGTAPAWFAYPLICKKGEDRDAITRELNGRGIETRHIAGGNLLRQLAFAHLRDCGGSFPNADRIHNGGFYIGLPPFAVDMRDRLNLLLGVTA